jgi:hypothetical protein
MHAAVLNKQQQQQAATTTTNIQRTQNETQHVARQVATV